MADAAASPLLQRLATAWPIDLWRDVPVLVAVSGGSDSVALLCGLKRLAPSEARLIVAHFNHQLRAEAADRDEAFVRTLANSLDLACHIGRGAVRDQAASDGDGIEAAARAQRYAFLEATAGEVGARYVATAHTADDQAETILQRIVRGTGIAGLAGIPRVRPLNPACSLVRPVLAFRRQELRAWLAEMGQTFCEDDSNFDRSFTRNRLRLDLLPQLAREYNPQVIDALAHLGTLAGEAQAEIDTLVEQRLPNVLLVATPERVVLHGPCLASDSEYLVRETFIRVWQQQRWPLQGMTFVHWQQLADMCRGERIKKITLPGGIVAQREGERIHLDLPH